MATESLKFFLEVEDRASRDLANARKEIERIQGVSTGGNAVNGITASFGQLTGAMTLGTIAAQGFAQAVGLIRSEAEASLGAFTKYQSTMLGLASTSAAFGQNQQAAMGAVKSLTSDGLIAQTTAAEGLMRLFASGLNLEEATNLIRAYKDQATFGRSSTISLDQAVGNLASSFQTENSTIGNLSGQTENYNLILARGAAALGKSVDSLNEAERTQAKYLGTMQLGQVVAGDTERSLDTLQGKQAQLNAAMIQFHQTVGQALAPAMEFLTAMMLEGAKAAGEVLVPNVKAIGTVLVDVAGVALTAGSIIKNVLVGIGKGVMDANAAMSKMAHLDFGGAMESAKKVIGDVAEIGTKTWEETGKIAAGAMSIKDKIAKGGFSDLPVVTRDVMNKTAGAIKKGSDKAAKELEQLAEKLKNVQEKMKKESDNFARSVADKQHSYNESMKLTVQAHIKSIQDLRKEIQELNDDFAEATAERQATHNEAVSNIKEKYEEDTKNLQDNLNRRLADSHVSDEQLTAFFQAQIAEKQKLRDADLAKEEEKNKLETEKALAAHQKQLSDIQGRLNAELEIQRAHQDVFNQFKDQAVEDDITRAQNAFAREMDQMKQQHNERMDELRKEQEEILALRAATEASIAKSIAGGAQARGVTAPKAAPKAATKSAPALTIQKPVATGINNYFGYNPKEIVKQQTLVTNWGAMR